MRTKILSFSILFSFLLLVTSLSGYDNIAAKYCKAMDYTYTIEHNKYGDQVGICVLPDDTKVDAWAFYKGKVAKRFSYCAKNGYRMISKSYKKNGYSADVPICEKQRKDGSTEDLSMVDIMEQEGKITIQKERPLLKKDKRIKLENPIKKRVLPKGTEARKEIRSYPSALDWRSYNGHSYIGAVRNQGTCGSCYAFGAAASAEGSYNFLNGLYDSNTIDLSEAYIAWCLGEYGPYSSHFGGCSGADYDYAELQALTVEGVTYEENFPYTGNDPGGCTHGSDPVLIYSSWGRVDPNDTDGIQAALSTYGVIDVAVYVTDDWENYSSGIFTDTQTDCPDGAYTTTNHAVALVGWGTDSAAGLYWILRNSWGSSWGEGGYMRIQANAARVACATTYLEAATSDQCFYSISPDSESFGTEGGHGTIAVSSSPEGCTSGSWSATETLDWVSFTGTMSGTGSGTWSVTYSVSANSSYARNGELSVAGSSFNVQQDGEAQTLFYDSNTGLMWQDQAYTQEESDAYFDNAETGKVLYWDNAVAYCDGLEIENYSNWHLPTLTELTTIVDAGNYPTIKSGFTNSEAIEYWSSTEYSSSEANLIDFSDGAAYYWAKSLSTYIRCVRPHSEQMMNPSIIMYLLN